MKQLLSVLLLLVSMGVLAQESTLVGKWKMLAMQMDDEVVFDLDDREGFIASTIARRKEHLKTTALAKEDSLQLVKTAHEKLDGLENVYLEFFEDGTYANTRLVGAGQGDVEQGHYEYDAATGRLVQTDGTRASELMVAIKENRLVLTMQQNATMILTYQKNEKE